MLTFLFWNVGGESPPSAAPAKVALRLARLRQILGNLSRQHDVDLLILAESPIPSGTLLGDLKHGNSRPFHPPDPSSLCERILIYSRLSPLEVSLQGTSESRKYTCRQVRLSGRPALLLFAAHFGSKLFQSDESQTLSAVKFSTAIQIAERGVRHTRTVLVGDLNMNPFDAAVVGAEGLNAVMTRSLALRKTRTVDSTAYPVFYNPMWGCFGDATHEQRPPGHPDHAPPGTCYYPARESRWYYWNVFDQVLIRPALLPSFRNSDLKILTTDGVTSFLTTRGTPDREKVSDHLPLLFRLSL